MIWYRDNSLIVEFDTEPEVTISYPTPWYSEKRKQETIEKPFLNKKEFHVKIVYKGNIYNFCIPKGYTWDGATIPKLFWRIIGSDTNPDFLIPSLIHDVLCEHHEYINYNRFLSSLVFEKLLYSCGVSAPKRWIMKHCVDFWQRFQHWEI